LRKQYHFQPSTNGFYAWDVDRLVVLTRNLEPNLVKLDSIKEIDENFWFNSKESIPTCRAIVLHIRLIIEADLEYPIILSADGSVMDGMHRVSKALLEERATIKAVRFIQTPKPDFEDVYPDQLPY